MDENPDKTYISKPVTEVEVSEQEVLNLLERLEEKINRVPIEAPPALLLLEEFSVCPQSLIDVEAGNIINLQANCENYHVAPYRNTWTKNPNSVIEGFEAIKEGSNLYTRWNMKQVADKPSGEKARIPMGAERRKLRQGG